MGSMARDTIVRRRCQCQTRRGTAACAAVGINVYALPAQVLPNDARELESFVRLWEREAALATSALFVEFHETENQFTPIRFVERVGGILFISAGEPVRLRHRPSISFDVAKPTADEQKALWRDAGVNGQVELLATQFDLSAVSIRPRRQPGQVARRTVDCMPRTSATALG